MATKYTVSKHDPKIFAVEVVKETEKTYTVQKPSWRGPAYLPTEERFMKSANPLYETWDDAQAALVERFQKEVECRSSMLAKSESNLAAAKAMSPF
jgi:hypothetical protein